MEFRRHRTLLTRNSVNTEFRRHGIPLTRNSPVNTEFCQFFYFRIFSMLCYVIYFHPNSDGISYTIESLQSHCSHTQSHWSSGSTLCFLS